MSGLPKPDYAGRGPVRWLRAANPRAVIARIAPAAMARVSGLGDVHEGSLEAGVAVGCDTTPAVTSGLIGAA